MNHVSEKQGHPIERLMADSMQHMRKLVDADTIVGSPVKTADGKIILPVSRVAMGFMTGGGEFSDQSTNRRNKEGFPFAGGSGGGVTVSPIGFLISDGDSIKMLSIDGETGYEKLLGLIPDVIESVIKGAKS